MHKLLAILSFYKLFMVWSLIVNVIIGIINPVIASALVTKLCLTVFAWYYVSETTNKRRLTFYKNLGIRPINQFASMFIIDSVITILFVVIFKEFS